jgi:hypothetical protein
LPNLNYFLKLFQASVFQKHLLNARIYARLKDEKAFEQEIDYAKNLSKNLPLAYQQEVDMMIKSKAQFWDQAVYVKDIKNPNYIQIINQVKINIKNDQIQDAFKGSLITTLLKPKNIEARLILANIFESMNENALEYQEYRNILKLDPNDQIANNKIISVVHENN